jgi:hypothetical protein
MATLHLVASTLSYGNASSGRLPSRAKTGELNLHHRRNPSSVDRPTPTLNCYKKIISNLSTHLITSRVFILSLPYLDHHVIGAPSTVIVLFHRCFTPIVPLHNNTNGDELTDLLSLTEQFINM